MLVSLVLGRDGYYTEKGALVSVGAERGEHAEQRKAGSASLPSITGFTRGMT